MAQLFGVLRIPLVLFESLGLGFQFLHLKVRVDRVNLWRQSVVGLEFVVDYFQQFLLVVADLVDQFLEVFLVEEMRQQHLLGGAIEVFLACLVLAFLLLC